jgi:Domain of unknown function (DUF4145)
MSFLVTMTPTPLPSHFRLVLDEARRAAKAKCPNGAVILARKIVEMYLDYEGSREQVWEVVVHYARDDGKIDSDQLSAALHIRSAGNRAAHSRHGVTAAEASKCLELAKSFLKAGGFSDPSLTSAMTLAQITSLHGRLSHDSLWRRAEPFNDNVTHWWEGGMVETLSQCTFCSGPVVCEDLVVSPVNMTADNNEQSMTYNGTFGVCLACEMDYRVDSTNCFGGWSVDIHPDGKPEKQRQAGRRWARILPPPRTGFFRHKIIYDNRDEPEP